MIELRYLVTYGRLDTDTIRTLQFRESDGTKSDGYGNEKTRWSKWQDVPEVDSELAEE